MSKRDDVAVRRAYLRRILGYDATEVKEEYKVNEEGELELQKKTTTTKHVPGDSRAAEFWLANQRPDQWRYPRFLAPEKAGDEEDAGVVELPPVEEEETKRDP